MTMVLSDIGEIAKLPFFDIRNGSVGDAVSLVTKPAIANAYKWIPIANLPAPSAVRYADLFVKSADYILQVHGPSGLTPAKRRKMAILLGTARATLTMYYSLTTGDLIPGETHTPVITYVPPAADATTPTWTVTSTLSAEYRSFLLANYAVTDEERGVMSTLILCSIGLPAVQGSSLIATGHHYLSNVREKSRGLFDVIEKQFWKTDEMKTWLGEDTETLRDMMWHKAGHPVNMAIKYRLAVDPRVPEMLKSAGAGSAASRLPAKEAELKAGETVRTLLINVRPFFESYRGSVSFEALTDAINMANCYIPSIMVTATSTNVIPGVDIALMRTDTVPANVVSRESAIDHIQDLLKRNADSIAIAFGFFEALCDSPMAGETTAEDMTLLGSYSLKKFKTQCFAAYLMGREGFGDYLNWKTKERTAGKYRALDVDVK